MANNLSEGLLLGIGNPLLDISANVEMELLEKYGLDPNGAIMAEEKHMPLYKELMENYKVEFIAGGSVQNSLRICQWVLKKPNVCTYFGCVGDDEYAKILKERAIADGVNPLYEVTYEGPTGTCGVLVTDVHRSLVANLAAAQKFTPNHLKKWESQKAIEKARYFYASGYFVAVSPESIMQLAQHSYSKGYTFTMNISAPFVVEFYKEQFEKLFPYIDILFGNQMEAEAFAKAFGITGNTEQIALQAAAMPKMDPTRERIVVFTHGPDPIVIVHGKNVQYVPVPYIEKSKMVDTTGAGDAFVGGFLAQLILGKPLTTCVECGIHCARYIIQKSGCAFEGECDFVASECKCDSDSKTIV